MKRLFEMLIMSFFSIVSLSSFFFVFAASQVTHVYFAQRYMHHLKPLYSQQEYEAFMRGTLFPDIRYMAKIPRKKTHVQDVRLHDIVKTNDAFQAGIKLHCFVDDKRAEITTAMNMHQLLKDIPKAAQTFFLKIVEDEIFYNDIAVSKAQQSLKAVDFKEMDGISPVIVKTWYETLDCYLQQPPHLFFSKKNTLVASFAGPAAERWRSKIKVYAKNKKMMAYVDTLKKEFEKMFKTLKKG